MKQIYKDENLEIVIPENYEENLINNNWCTVNKERYDFHTKKLNQTLFRFIYADGHLISLGVDKNMQGQWLDNMKNDNNQSTIIYLRGGDIFNIDKMREVSEKNNNFNLKHLAIKIAELPEEIKNIILQNI